MILIGFTIPAPKVCDRHTNCGAADEWAKRFGKTVEHVNQRAGVVERFVKPVCAAPGCSVLVFEWGAACERHTTS